MKMFQFYITIYDKDGNILYQTLQEVPADNEYHWSKVVKRIV